MSRNHHPLDVYVRRAAPMRDEQPPRPESEAQQAMLEEIMATPTGRRDIGPDSGAGRRRRTRLLVGAGVAVAATTAAGWAMYGSVHSSTSVGCRLPDGLAVVDAVSGDPVADCAAVWRRDRGMQPPKLTAYDNGRGGIEVRPAADPAPAGYRPLPPTFAQNSRTIELESSLGDYVDGLQSDCLADNPATAVARAELERLGLTDWTVTVERGRSDGMTTCARFLLADPDRRRVVLAPEPALGNSDAPHVRLAQSIGDSTATCLDTDEAGRRIRNAAKRLGLTETAREYQLTVVPDSTTKCARVDLTVGGTIFIVIRGPAAAGR